MNRRPIIALAVIFSFQLSIPTIILAQNPPPSDGAGAQVERFKTGVEREKERAEAKPLKAPEIEIAEEKEKPPAQVASFLLNEVNISGATTFSEKEFVSIYETYLHKLVSFDDLNRIAIKIKEKYRSKWYLTSTVYIPEQEIREGKVEIRVIEGKMGRLITEGNRWVKTKMIERYFHTKKGEVLNVRKMERDVLRLNQNPDIEVKTVISAGQEAETSDITLKVSDKFPWHAGLSEDNLGTRLVGKYRTSLYVRSTSVTGWGDSVYANSLITADSFGEFVSYTVPLGTYGAKAGFDFTHFGMKLGREYRDEDITGYTEFYTPRLSWEMYLSADFQANIETGLEIKSIRRMTRSDTTSNDQLRTPYIGYSFTKIDSLGGQTTFTPRFSFGTKNILGELPMDRPKPGRDTTEVPFVKYEHTIRRIQRMPWESYMILNSQFQAPSRTLPSSEQMQLGGLYSVRGYPEGDYLADIGASLNADWVFPMYLVPKDWKLPKSDTPLRKQIEPVAFFDIGWGQLRNVFQGERYTKLLIGAGGGARVRLYDRIYLRLEWAQPIGDAPTPGADLSTFHLVFQAEM